MLVAVGLGPGDPELLTLKAVRLLKEADAVFVPGSLAYQLVAGHRADATVLEFPMTDDEDHILSCLERNAEIIAPAARAGCAVFGIIGDPNFFSTFTRLQGVIRESHPDIAIRTVPGISSITAFAAVAGVPVSGGFEVSDGSAAEAKVVMKVTRPRDEAARMAREGYRRFVLVERMFMEDQAVYRGDELPEKSSYFSILYAGK